ncbi:MAG: hypothetical protein V7K77_10265 [Nostoc sp.]
MAIREVRCLDTNVAILSYLLAELEAIKVNVKALCLNRGFFSIAVIRWLQALDITFVMPVIRIGKKGGVNQFIKDRINQYFGLSSLV